MNEKLKALYSVIDTLAEEFLEAGPELRMHLGSVGSMDELHAQIDWDRTVTYGGGDSGEPVHCRGMVRGVRVILSPRSRRAVAP